jgi:hypothetical protein
MQHRSPIQWTVLSGKNSRPAQAYTFCLDPSEYFAFAAGVLKGIDAKAGDRRSATTLPHPWFGQLNARGWLWLLGAHTRVHLRQVREIRKGM